MRIIKLKSNTKVVWKSLNKRIVIVNSKGVVKGVRKGKAAIKVILKLKPKKTKIIYIRVFQKSVLSGMIGDTENRLSRTIFKLAVEVSMLLHVTASQSTISDEDMIRLRGFCVDEVSKLSGRISFENAYRHQKS